MDNIFNFIPILWRLKYMCSVENSKRTRYRAPHYIIYSRNIKVCTRCTIIERTYELSNLEGANPCCGQGGHEWREMGNVCNTLSPISSFPPPSPPPPFRTVHIDSARFNILAFKMRVLLPI